MLLRTLLLAVVATVIGPSQAGAQIYVWRDGNGNLVLSDRQLDAGAVTYAVPNAPAFRATRPAAPAAVQGRFESLVQEHAARRGLRPDLVRAVIQVESGFNPRATSPKGAMGLMQLMPATARDLGVRDAYNPSENIRGGTDYLRHLLDRYAGSEELALAAYNAGAGAVNRYGRQVPPFAETTDYVRKVGSAAGTAPNPAPGPVPAKRIIYKAVDVIDGQPVTRYTTERPASGAYQIVER